MARTGEETWTGWVGLEPYDRDKLAIALKAAHVSGVAKGADMVICNSVDFAMLADIMHSCNVHHVPGKFKAVAFSDAEMAEMEKQLGKDITEVDDKVVAEVRQ